MKHPWTGLKNIPRNIWLVSSATLINRAGTMVLPFIALYAKQELNVTTGEAGLVLAFYGIGALISSPFSGKLSDKIGPLKLMTISLISSGLFLFLYSAVQDFRIFLGLSFIWAILNEAFRPASMSFISSEITPDRRKTAFALNRLAINLGMSIGPVIGGILSTINFSLLFYVDGITSLAAGSFLIISHWQKHEVEDERVGVKGTVEVANKVSLIKNKKFLYFILAFIPVQIVFFQHIGALPLFIVNELGFSNAVFGYLIAINTVLIIFVEVPLNDAMRTWENHKSLALGALLSALGFGLLAFLEDIQPIILLIIIWTFGEMILFPASGDYVASISPEKQRGEYMGYFQMSFSFSFMVGPWLGAEALDHFGSLSLWASCFVLGMISAFMLFRIKSRKASSQIVNG
ncbi:MAG: MFS transporter [Ignavibacteriaceae bacterium]